MGGGLCQGFECSHPLRRPPPHHPGFAFNCNPTALPFSGPGFTIRSFASTSPPPLPPYLSTYSLHITSFCFFSHDLNLFSRTPRHVEPWCHLRVFNRNTAPADFHQEKEGREKSGKPVFMKVFENFEAQLSVPNRKLL